MVEERFLPIIHWDGWFSAPQLPASLPGYYSFAAVNALYLVHQECYWQILCVGYKDDLGIQAGVNASQYYYLNLILFCFVGAPSTPNYTTRPMN